MNQLTSDIGHIKNTQYRRGFSKDNLKKLLLLSLNESTFINQEPTTIETKNNTEKLSLTINIMRDPCTVFRKGSGVTLHQYGIIIGINSAQQKKAKKYSNSYGEN